MIFMLVLIVLFTVVGIGLFATMFRRDEPVFGTAGLAVLLTAGVISTVYGLLSAE